MSQRYELPRAEKEHNTVGNRVGLSEVGLLRFHWIAWNKLYIKSVKTSMDGYIEENIEKGNRICQVEIRY